MARLKVVLLLGISYAAIWNEVSTATVPSPAPSIDLFFPPQAQDATNQSATSTTIAPSISERIQASLHNVLRIPLPLWGTASAPGSGAPTLSQAQQQQQNSLPTSGGSLEQYQKQQIEQQSRLGQKPQQIGVFGESHGAPPPVSFLPDVNQAIHSTIAQLSTLSHWPFGYVTTSKPQQAQQQQQQTVQTIVPTTAPLTQTTNAPPKTTTIAATTTKSPSSTVQTTTSIPSTLIPAQPPLPPARPTQPMTAPPPPQSFSQFVLPPPSSGEPSFPFLPSVQAAPTQSPRPSLPNRIHNRINAVHATLNNYIRLPNLSQIGQNRPRPMITEPPWVTELLGPTLEPPTTRAPTLSERVQNSIQNVLLFVPATLLNFWYQNWGTQQVDRFVSRLQLSTPRPGSPASPVFATIPQQGPNPFANFTADSFRGNGTSPVDWPAIAAFINSNGTLMPTIVHPVVNMTANTIEYQLRSENETTVLWTGTLSNDIFFGNMKRVQGENGMEIEDDEDEQMNVALNVVKEEED